MKHLVLALILLCPAFSVASDAGIADAGVVVSKPVEASAVSAVPGPIKSDVPAPAPQVSPAEIPDQVVAAAKSGNWTLLFGLILTFVVYAANRVGLAKFVGRKNVPIVTVGLGVLGSIATGIVSGQSLAGAVVEGLLVGAQAIAFWEVIAKRFASTKSDGSAR